MQLNVRPIQIEGLNCVDHLMVTIATWLGRDYGLKFIDAWQFNFVQDGNDIFGRRIYYTFEPFDMFRPEMSDFLVKYHGIHFTWHNTHTFEEVFPIVQSELQSGRPVICAVDGYWIPNFVEYKKQNMPHYILVTGISESGANLVFLDSRFGTHEEVMGIDEFKQGCCFHCGSYELTDGDEKSFSWNMIIKDSIMPTKKYDMFNTIRRFGAELEKHLNLPLEMEENNKIWDAPILLRLAGIKTGRLKYAMALQYLSEKYKLPELEPVVEKLKYITSRWELVFSHLIKAYMAPNNENIASRVASRIKEIADLEEEVFHLLLDICDGVPHARDTGENTHRPEFEEITIKANKIVFFDLKPYMNCRAFADSNNQRGNANFDNIGTYYLTGGIPTDSILEVDDLKFYLPKVSDGASDNLVCLGQKIIVAAAEEYLNIMLLGSGDMGNFPEQLLINYQDGAKEVINFGFSDHTSVTPVFGEIIAADLKMVGTDKHGNKVFHPNPGHLFAKSYLLHHQGKISFIQLPDLSNLHIFAISFGSVE